MILKLFHKIPYGSLIWHIVCSASASYSVFSSTQVNGDGDQQNRAVGRSENLKV